MQSPMVCMLRRSDVVQVLATSPAARRYIISFSCTGAFDIEAAAHPSGRSFALCLQQLRDTMSENRLNRKP